MNTVPNCETKTTKNLVAGDVILDGNMFYGYTTKTVVNVEPANSKSSMLVTFEYANGNVSPALVFGKTTRWSVIEAK